MNFLQVARKYATQVHEGQRFKYVEGPYIRHPIAVSERLHTVHEKALALVHDAPERRVEVWLGKTYTLEQEEEAIARALLEMQRFFAWYGIGIERSFLGDLDVLTKRKMDGRSYSGYLGGTIAHARKTSSIAVVKVKVPTWTITACYPAIRRLPIKRQKTKTAFVVMPLDAFK